MNLDRYTEALSSLREAGNYRMLRDARPMGNYVEIGGRKLLNLSSNDYLGLSGQTEMLHDFYAADCTQDMPMSSVSSRLLSGNHVWYRALEDHLGELYGRAALVLGSGYHANTGILPALTTRRDLIIADKLVHASTIDGFRLSDATLMRYRHLDLVHLRRQLSEHRSEYDNVFIVSESIFSMDGDEADIRELIKIKDEYDAALYIDEAHSVGVRGQKGLGLCEEMGCTDEVDLIVGTFGKAYASVGAFVVCDAAIRDYLINTQRTLIFSTALPPTCVAWTDFVLNRMSNLETLRESLKARAEELRKVIEEKGFETRGTSHIVPLICGENERALQISAQLDAEGIFALPVRYPTVPKGEARIRFSLNASLTDEEFRTLTNAIRSL